MRPDGGEARRITDAKDGVTDFALAKDGKSLIYRAGRAETRQLYRLPLPWTEGAEAEQLTKQPTGVDTWTLVSTGSPDLLHLADKFDADEKARRDKKFTVNIRNAETPTPSLWALDLEPRRTATREPGRHLLRRRTSR